MGLYLNPGNEPFASIVKNDIYVDKTGLITYMNGCIGKAKHLIASSRPRRFGKTLAAQMLTAYYSKGCDSRELFQKFEIAKDPSYEKHLNKYDVISMDIQEMRSIYLQIKNKNENSILEFMQEEVIHELRTAYPSYVDPSCSVIAQALVHIHAGIGTQFVIIIDDERVIIRTKLEKPSKIKEFALI